MSISNNQVEWLRSAVGSKIRLGSMVVVHPQLKFQVNFHKRSPSWANKFK